MKSLHKQQGFALIAGLLIVIAVLSIGSIQFSQYLSKKRILNNTESFFNRVVYLRTQIHAYANDHYLQGHGINSPSIFPARLTDLEGTYVPACSTADNKNGLCMKVTQTPWGEIAASDYRRALVTSPSGANYYRAELDLKLPAKDDAALKYERSATLSLLAQLPNIVYDDARNLITVRIDRPDKAFAYESLVKRSGDDSTLLGDWDVGGDFSITNTRDVTIRNSNGTQKLVSRGLSNVFTVNHGDMVKKPDCPTGTTPSINLALGYVRIEGNVQLVGSQKPYLMSETATEWQVGLVLRVKNLITGAYEIENTGEILAITQCK
ncbi:type II secretion system protein (plasmid) [Vibrio alfacsensis]|uniref:type II secretion system protein n=1 Tax=Vibrio alfacsensis TaxID=1074311 RepID=UPI002ADE63E0|nr:type II secretion system protein [Vibrio alfacsensis]WQE79436.1 type II secretion system protein [Vibrio alfacsensis]